MSKISVSLEGIRPIMFDRYPGSNTEQLEWKDKVYQEGGNLVMPPENIMSFLSAQNTESAPQRVMGKRWKTVCKAAMSFVTILTPSIPFTRNGNPIPANQVVRHFAVARMKKQQLSIPNPKERPLLALPWNLSWDMSLFKNPDLTESILKKLFEDGGITIGFGTWRGLYGKF